MSERDNSGENFLQRWSRRKQAARTPVREVTETPGQDEAEPRLPSGVAPLETVKPAFDLASLPPVESITAASDVSAFLAPGVPDEIVRAALRRAWVTDPAIRDFVGIAENQWDFANPDGIPGFGGLDLTPELRRMVADLFSNTPAGTEPAPAEVAQGIGNYGSALTPTASDKASDKPGEMPVAEASAPSETPAQPAAGPDPVSIADAALQRGADGMSISLRRRHGRAVPE
jgi:hypothetical protein